MLFVVGMAGVMQMRSNAADDAYTNARREDLISAARRAGGRVAAAGERDRRAGADQEPAAVRRRHPAGGPGGGRSSASTSCRSWPARRRPRVPGSGCGSPIPAHKVTADVLLDAVEEMRDAGAEVIEVNDTVRVVGLHLVRPARGDSW